MASERISTAQPRWWALKPTMFGQAIDLPFKDEPSTPSEAAAWAAAKIQSDVIAFVTEHRASAGFRSWSAMSKDARLGLSRAQLTAVVRGESWLRLEHIAALAKVLGQPLLMLPHEVQALKDENAEAVQVLEIKNNQLAEANTELDSKRDEQTERAGRLSEALDALRREDIQRRRGLPPRNLRG